MSAIRDTSDPFGPPVGLHLGPAGNIRYTVNSPMLAARLLLEEWPETAGPAYVEACRTCLAALKGNAPAATARTALIAAAREAGILAEFVPPRSSHDRGRRPTG